MRDRRGLVWLSIIVASVGWGTGDVVTRVALGEGIGPYTLSALRCAVAAAGVAAYLLIRRNGRLAGMPIRWKLATVQGIANLAAPYLLITLALQYASAGFVGIVIALAPVCTAAFAHVMLSNERLRPAVVAGLAVALVGVSILLLSGDTGLSTGGRPLLAFLLTGLAVVLIGYGGVYAKRYADDYNAIELGLQQFVVGAVLLSVLMLIVEGRPVAMGGNEWLLIGYTGLIGTLVPFLAFFWCLQHASATLSSLSGYLTPPITVAVGIAFLDERLQPGLAIGGAIIMVGVAITEYLDRRRPELPAAGLTPNLVADERPN